jgi:hypothetical protein
MSTESIWNRQDYVALTKEQISQLTNQGCNCNDWSKVGVASGFNVERVKSTTFSGQIRLGVFDKYVRFTGGIEKPAGIYNAVIHNCIIGNNVRISNVKNYMANYMVDDDAVIENIDVLAVDGQTSFGNGTLVAAVNEAGGREIPIYDNLTAQTAYIIAFYRHRTKVIKFLQEKIEEYSRSVTSSMGLVGKAAILTDCRLLKNLKIGPACVIEAATRCENGSINSTPLDPVYIGPDVFAEDFIASSGAKITDGTIISKCFIGQGTVLAKQYSAENSVFFANCGGYHGEACAIFAGPFTVTHHKSTLLIAGLFSFLNAGSGTNQSNHMYKLGPVHQGIVERGSKTASDSYMLWPAKVGAFTVVMGRHYRNSDTSDLPFSYLIEHEDESILAPGVNLRSVGTVRDAKKWPTRDHRKDSVKMDLINFKLLSPFTIQKMINGLNLLMNLRTTSGETSEFFTYHSVKITRASMERGLKLYEIGIYKFIGNCLIHRLQGKEIKSIDQLRQLLRPQTSEGCGKWLDLVGLFAPDAVIEKLLCDIENGHISTLKQVTDAFISIHENYPTYEWAWAANVMQELLCKKIDQIIPDDITKLTKSWIKAVVDLDHQLEQDAAKEFDPIVQIGFGVDGNVKTRQEDFAAVRGTYEQQSFVKDIKKHISAKTALADELIDRMNALKSK